MGELGHRFEAHGIGYLLCQAAACPEATVEAAGSGRLDILVITRGSIGYELRRAHRCTLSATHLPAAP